MTVEGLRKPHDLGGRNRDRLHAVRQSMSALGQKQTAGEVRSACDSKRTCTSPLKCLLFGRAHCRSKRSKLISDRLPKRKKRPLELARG